MHWHYTLAFLSRWLSALADSQTMMFSNNRQSFLTVGILVAELHVELWSPGTSHVEHGIYEFRREF